MNTQQIQGKWTSLKGQVKEKWGQLTNDDLQLAEGNFDQFVGRLQQKTGAQRQEIEKFFDDLMSKGSSVLNRIGESATEMAQQAGDKISEGYGVVSEKVTEGYENVRELVKHNPAQSLAVVLGGGLVAGFLVGLLIRSND